ncbi:MAG: type IV toxin-antitoxin system AbiEi family antitoxin domain-containing protein [Candidatus Latescibacteria bacterium]|nr:type IV toxin-antitoxin system AbiEi family antitoxin domain-containing protein [Candidatus Latescibacterota bacterium]
MKRQSILRHVKNLHRIIFTTREAHAVSGKSLSNVVQGLNHLCRQDVLVKICRGVWAETSIAPISPFRIIPYLPGGQRTYISFLSALHIHGIIEQIPQMITCASLAHTRTLTTALGVFSIHRIAPDFFFGFNWYKQNGEFLVAEPEKALLDCLYLSGRKGNQFKYFPELIFPRSFNWAKAQEWTGKIQDPRLRTHVGKRLAEIKKLSG